VLPFLALGFAAALRPAKRLLEHFWRLKCLNMGDKA
jgi:hypothetical protein